MIRQKFYAVCLIASTLIGCRGSIDTSPVDSMTLYSLDGTFEESPSEKATGEIFHRFPVLGTLEIASRDDQTSILDAVSNGIARSDGTVAQCFWPRHGIRITRKGKTIDYLICFECLIVREYENGNFSWSKTTTKSPAEELDKHLVAAGVPQQKSPF